MTRAPGKTKKLLLQSFLSYVQIQCLNRGSNRFIRQTPVADLEGDQREPWPPLREEKAIDRAHKFLLEGAKIIDYCLFNPTVEGE